MKRLAKVAGGSMAPTYRSSDLLLTRPVGRRGRSVRRGDVVVFRRDGALMVKRVVAMHGDVVEMEAGRLSVNGKTVDGRPHVTGASKQTWRVPAGNLFVAGDNSMASDDSRVWAQPFIAAGTVESVVTRRLTPRRQVSLAGRAG